MSADPLTHARDCLDLAEAIEPELWGPELVTSMEQLEHEHDDLRTALGWAIDAGEAEIALRLGAALWRFWEVRGYLAEGLDWLDRALAMDADPPLDVKARALDAAGNLARSLGQFERASSFYVRSLQVRLKLGDTRGAALVLNNLAVAAQFTGNTDASLLHQEASLDLFRELGDPAGVALSMVTLGTMAQLQGESAAARRLFEESMGIFRGLNDKRGVAASLNNLGNTAIDAGDVADARRFYAEALELFRELGDMTEEAACLKNLTLVELKGGALARATELCGQSLDLYDDLADGRGVAACLDVLGRVAAGRRDFEAVATVSGAAQRLRELLGFAVGTSQEGSELAESAARAALGEARFQELSTEGRMMPLADAIARGLRLTGKQLELEGEV